jgi:hypothetical protein
VPNATLELVSRFLSRKSIVYWNLALQATAAYYPDDEKTCAFLKERFDLIVTPAHLASLRYERRADFLKIREQHNRAIFREALTNSQATAA